MGASWLDAGGVRARLRLKSSRPSLRSRLVARPASTGRTGAVFLRRFMQHMARRRRMRGGHHQTRGQIVPRGFKDGRRTGAAVRAQTASQLHGVACIKLGEDAGAMGLGGAQRNAQVDGDDFIRAAGRHIVNDLPFAGRQRGKRRFKIGTENTHGATLFCNVGLQEVCPAAQNGDSWQFCQGGGTLPGHQPRGEPRPCAGSGLVGQFQIVDQARGAQLGGCQHHHGFTGL